MDLIIDFITRVCADCDRSFDISPGEQEFFRSHNLELPKRCRPCRQSRKAHREKSPTVVRYERDAVEVTPASDARNVGNAVEQLLGK